MTTSTSIAVTSGQLLLPIKSESGQADYPIVNLRACRLAAWLLEEGWSAKTRIFEASVHRSRRSKIFVASYTAAEGGQIWRTTGQKDYNRAISLARRWESEAREERARLGGITRKPGTRVRHAPGLVGSGIGPLTQAETAAILHISVRAVRQIELRAIRKLREHPLLRDLWRGYLSGELNEDGWELDPAEVAALFDLAETPDELSLLEKVLAIVQR